jgi:collagen type VII alpha
MVFTTGSTGATGATGSTGATGNTYVQYNKFKATKIYGAFEVRDYIGATGNLIDSGIITCKDLNSSGVISMTSTQLPITENSTKIATTSWVKSLGYITAGATGAQGFQGSQGATGPTGAQGSQGSQGLSLIHI